MIYVATLPFKNSNRDIRCVFGREFEEFNIGDTIIYIVDGVATSCKKVDTDNNYWSNDSTTDYKVVVDRKLTRMVHKNKIVKELEVKGKKCLLIELKS